MLNAAPKAHSPSVDGCVCMCVRVWYLKTIWKLCQIENVFVCVCSFMQLILHQWKNNKNNNNNKFEQLINKHDK